MSEPRVESYRGKAFLILLAVFLGGAVAGAVSTKIFQRYVNVADSTEGRPHVHNPSVAVDHLREELELDAGQVNQLQGILDHCIMKEADLLSQIEYAKEDGRRRILKILNEQQRGKFDAALLQVSGE